MGKTTFFGNQYEAITEYIKDSSESSQMPLNGDFIKRRGSGALKITSIEMKDTKGNSLTTVTSGQSVEFHLGFEKTMNVSIDNALVGISLKTHLEVPVFLHHSRLTQTNFGNLPDKGVFICRIESVPLPSASYSLGFSIMQNNEYVDSVSNAFSIEVIDGFFFSSGEVPPISHGVCLVNADWSLKESY